MRKSSATNDPGNLVTTNGRSIVDQESIEHDS